MVLVVFLLLRVLAPSPCDLRADVSPTFEELELPTQLSLKHCKWLWPEGSSGRAVTTKLLDQNTWTGYESLGSREWKNTPHEQGT